MIDWEYRLTEGLKTLPDDVRSDGDGEFWRWVKAVDVELLIEATFADQEATGDVPMIDGCRVVHRGDGFDVCRVHYRHWRTGTEMCPGRNGR